MTREDIRAFDGMADHDILVKLAQAFVDFKEHLDERCHNEHSRISGLTWTCGIIGVALVGAFIGHLFAG